MTPDDATEVVGPIQITKGTEPSPSLEQAREFARHSKAESTLRGYQSDWRDFCAWCDSHSLCPLPASPESVASYIAECASRLKTGTIQRRLNAIAEAHKAMGRGSPISAGIVRNTLKGIRRTLGTATVQKAPTLIEDVRVMIDATDAPRLGTAAVRGSGRSGGVGSDDAATGGVAGDNGAVVVRPDVDGASPTRCGQRRRATWRRLAPPCPGRRWPARGGTS